MDMLPKLAQIHYSKAKIGRREALMKLMNEHLLVLGEFIVTKTELGEDLRYLTEPLESKSFELLARMKPLLEKIYREYWPF